LQTLLDFVRANRDWLFSGLGITIVTIVLLFGRAAYQALRGRRPPDLRLKVVAAITYHPGLGTGHHLSITVQNFSSFQAFVQGFYLELAGHKMLVVERDGITGEYQGKHALVPGDSRDLHIP
jgi:hypothetical protein